MSPGNRQDTTHKVGVAARAQEQRSFTVPAGSTPEGQGIELMNG